MKYVCLDVMFKGEKKRRNNMKQKELNEIVQLHKMWLNDEEGGMRAILSRADLRHVDLRRANLGDTNLWANLKNNLRDNLWTNLDANLRQNFS